MKVFISSSHSAFFKLTTSIPRERKVSSPPTKVLFSPLSNSCLNKLHLADATVETPRVESADLHHDPRHLV